MAVKDINEPPTKVEINPKGGKTEEGDASYWEGKAKATRAKREYEEEQRRIEGLGREPELPFKVKGEVNLGTYDLQKNQEKLENTITSIQSTYEEKIASLSSKADNYREKVTELQVKSIESQMQARMDNLVKLLEQKTVIPQQPTLEQEISRINQLADALGYKKVSKDDNTPIEIRLEIAKLEMEEKARAREFERQMKNDDRNWQLKFEEIKMQNARDIARLTNEKEKTDMVAALPELFGRAAGKAIIEGGNQPITTESPPAKRTTAYHIEAPEGEYGETDCGNCKKSGITTTIAIAPTTKSAVCPECNIRIPITRIKQETVTAGIEEDEE